MNPRTKRKSYKTSQRKYKYVCDSGLGKDKGGSIIHLRKISILDFIKIQNFCSINDTFKKIEKTIQRLRKNVLNIYI